ncbi:hypothetical protein RHO12_02925 [Orbus sturtevantii]|uniref:hypothetical protein n=1 Tax=Orbus sturtevantii TaxID=3074109 RepID=UPI00370DDFBE
MLKILHILCVVSCLLFSTFIFSHQNETIVHGPFNISWCGNGQFYFEETHDLEYPIHFILECGDEKKIIDRYYVDGANFIILSNRQKPDMGIESVFFQEIGSKKHLFVIIKRNITHRALGINGDDYRVYAYENSPKNIIQLDKNIMKDNNLSGFEGESDGEESHFKYKTAAEVKKYIKETYNKK